MLKNFKKNKFIILIFSILFFCVSVYYFFIYNNDSEIEFENEVLESSVLENTNTKDDESNKIENIVVHIAGYVKNPGVVELPENSRVTDAIERAGGLTEEGDISEINLAYVLEDGIKIYIPSHNEVMEEKNMENNKVEYKDDNFNKSTGSKESVNNNFNTKTDSTSKVNINTATKTELENLPGIGSAIADRIIEYRSQNGKFKQIDDIKSVKGIGDSKFDKIKELIYVK